MPAPSTAAHAVPAPLRILVVDDDPLLLKSLRDTLEGDGHTIVAAKIVMDRILATDSRPLDLISLSAKN